MARERHRRLLLLRAPPHLLPVAAVLRREHEVTELRVVVAIRPAEVIALVHPQQLLRRLFGALLGGEKLGPVLEELVPAVLRGPQLAVWRDHHPHGVANPGGVMRPALFGLVLLSRIEAPDPRSRGELGARVLPRRFVRPIGDLTHIRWRADVDEQGLAVGGERQIPRAVPASGKVPHDHARLAHRLEPAGGEREPIHRGGGAEVQRALAQHDARAARGAGGFPLVGLPVATRVAQGEDAALRPPAAPVLERDEDVAVGRDGKVARTADLVGHDDGAESRGERDASVVGIAGG